MKKIVNVTVLFLLLGLISGCNQQAQSDANVMAVDAHKQEKLLASKNASAKYLAAHKSSHKTTKSHAAIFMQYELLSDAVLNQKLQVKLVFEIGHNVESLQVEYFTLAGLTILNSQNPIVFNMLSKDAKPTLLLDVMPESSGEHVINISATIQTAEGRQSRSFEIPVSLNSKNQPKLQLNKAQSGTRFIPDQNVISMPAASSPP